MRLVKKVLCVVTKMKGESWRGRKKTRLTLVISRESMVVE
jgi:hypothetical protein